jgi:hypothetical protein
MYGKPIWFGEHSYTFFLCESKLLIQEKEVRDRQEGDWRLGDEGELVVEVSNVVLES